MLHPDRILQGYQRVRDALLAEQNAAGHWEGELSTSPLSTATAVMALEMVRRNAAASCPDVDFERLIARGIAWLAQHQRADGGWGDTLLSVSNISTTMLAHAVFHATQTVARHAGVVAAAQAYIDRAGGVPALRARYGKDRTFSVPILTHCALAGLVKWREITPLPFELACLPADFYKWIRLPVVSYALPALIAIGQVRFHAAKPWNPVLRAIRSAAVEPSLRLLGRIQPTSGGFLEATPLTSFVTMSLAGMGRAEHPVARQGIDFLVRSVRPDGSWPIDTNLATWVTTLSINALGGDLPGTQRAALRDWLLGQQYRAVHPYTNADPGGWAWTDLSGGVPDADDTPGALLALLTLQDTDTEGDADADAQFIESLRCGVAWLLGLQNRDGGWPTFCRGWGALPFDRSAPDLTAHAIRALTRWLTASSSPAVNDKLRQRANQGIVAGFRYLAKTQRTDGSWLPLWFGNQYVPNDENPTYGTARVLAAYQATGQTGTSIAQRGFNWLRGAQNPDGGWGGAADVASSVEETALAVQALAALDVASPETQRGADWLLRAIDENRIHQQAPIGFYFAKLWYSERLYPLIFAAAALREVAQKIPESITARGVRAETPEDARAVLSGGIVNDRGSAT